MQQGDEQYHNYDVKAAFESYVADAVRGNSEAQTRLGSILLWGEGPILRDQATAATWFLKAAKQGNAVAMANLGYLYQEGVGVARDLEQAAVWYGRAAELGNERGRVMRPILDALILADRPAAGGVPDSMLIGAPVVRCEPRAHAALAAAEALLAPLRALAAEEAKAAGEYSASKLWAGAILSPGELYGRRPAQSSVTGGAAYLAEDALLPLELIGEYAAAGCFADATRLLDAHKRDLPWRRTAALKGVVQALVRYRQYERATALAYAGGAQVADLLETEIVAIALAGDQVAARNAYTGLTDWGGRRVQRAFGRVTIELAYARRDADFLAFIAPVQEELGIDDNIWLAQAQQRLGHRAEALRALRLAQSQVPQVPAWMDRPAVVIAGAQAMLVPEEVEPTAMGLNDIKRSMAALTAAVRAGTSPVWRQRWIARIDALAPALLAQAQTDKRRGEPLCEAALAFARIGRYAEALQRRQAWGCGYGSAHQRFERELVPVAIIAALRGEIAKVAPLIPPDRRMQAGKVDENYLGPWVYSLARAGRHGEALATLRRLEASSDRIGFHEDVGFLRAVMEGAGAGFPFGAWLEEVLANEDGLGVSRRDALRMLFAACARVRGYEQARVLADYQLSGGDAATALLGIAYGLRGHRIALDPDPYTDEPERPAP